MSDQITVVVCEIQKPPYRAEMTFEQIGTLLDDIIEVIPPAALKAAGNECPLPNFAAILAGETATVIAVPPPMNRFGVLGNFVISGARGYSLRRDRVQEVIELVQTHDSTERGRSFSLPSGAVTAALWQRGGKVWSPDAHLTGDLRRAEVIRYINYLLLKYAEHIVPFHLYRPLGTMYSLELQFAVTAEGQDRARSFVTAYENGFDARGKLKAAARKVADELFGQSQVQP